MSNALFTPTNLQLVEVNTEPNQLELSVVTLLNSFHSTAAMDTFRWNGVGEGVKRDVRLWELEHNELILSFKSWSKDWEATWTKIHKSSAFCEKGGKNM